MLSTTDIAAPQANMKMTIGAKYPLPVFILITHKHRNYDKAKVRLVTMIYRVGNMSRAGENIKNGR